MASALVPLNSTMVAVALPTLARAFGIGRGKAGVLITVYLLAMLIGQPLAGRLSDAIGNKRLVMVSVVGFGVCSFGAALSTKFVWLVASRASQAVFASALAPAVQSMLRSLSAPSDRCQVFGILGSVIGVGAAAGPIVGGVLVGSFGWKAIFLVNLPVVAIILVVLATVKVESIQLVNTDPRMHLDKRKPQLLNPTYVAAFATQALTNLGQYSLLLIAPIVFDERGWKSGETGLALSALTIGLIVMSPIGGRYGDEFGRRWAVTRGLGVAVVGGLILLPFGIGVSPPILISTLGAFGIGLGFASPSILAAGLEAVSDERSGIAAGLLSASRYVGSILASLLLSAFVADNGSGARIMFIATAAASMLAMTVGFRLPQHPASNTPLAQVT